MTNKEVLDNASLQRALTRITYEIIERNKGGQDLILVGIKTRGEFLAQRIASRLEQLEGVKIPVMAIDITNFRDDVLNQEDNLGLNEEEKNNIADKNIVLIDDVLFTGRTIRAALDALIHIGRPNSISLAVLVDRGHRELPIRADFVGKNIPTAQNEKIKVLVQEIDGHDAVEIVH
ncbi:MAG: bifunctional pyr operon transcriptional regulator/uracil phosphoribosyltransferase PyrR [Leuconostoc gelidum]|jgi:pyrimidine operon attenuation protein/uracil phosphoribosyltransferase|uniref:Bifunctional protein PyrR n=1 Tax=Leuconostoc gelidum subsp. gelidum TaxID=1607839 RepID=A0AB35FWY9_LEUGE|nr:bifunctional pyr operon transcriptional regulator/uracil phosphoribosyltransferase PyrR [Leuconostoc gelidum]AFS40202.1 PyrR bifunctional protein [Leuconostoc gelidum JB7]MBZ5964288.1 bifunctional pyr operon transcriptional regulator/uracil phosphoribosyltransferase PyrR [Leuconostoc gelidum subsp. gelidum]MBZ5975113.1 bifunctional pyr operon transcriptional regulator/uracil phosphoribosyltransferase PyrR [Leuconostoc gelidum subsp. gelidum]MBZ5976937.1 bifunctional pyr operon transcriptiona